MPPRTPLLIDVKPTSPKSDAELQSKVAAYVRAIKSIGLIHAAFKLLSFLVGISSLGDFMCYIFQCLILKSAMGGGMFGRDVPSTITLLLYLYSSFSTLTLLILFAMQIVTSQNTRNSYRFLLELGEKEDQFWDAMYVVAQLGAVIQLEYKFWVDNLYANPTVSRDDLWDRIAKVAVHRVEAVEIWRLEKQPGYREKQTPEFIQKLNSFWRDITSRVTGE
ncbi:hypothetical protein L207DRAFT_535552 [Hyaloscypha variabilis F]|jgi:hypothetical protein|uniref:Uncharacterized protein n=1 Tax=Hyaloscypha variabilis (strain UAMH 11265 / GT02V1 / F) TaxID=1149755 RepID=A0A2J6R4U3_HYAVF|nr:hypothetical protein L207DRAFT_535552 [Hyaloscypha variabilis F]